MRLALSIVCILVSLLTAARALPTPTCTDQVVGVDTSLATGLGGPILGESLGQGFLAPDSLIRAITVWRIASESWNDTGLHLFITRADSSGKPVPNSILLDGPTLVRSLGDGIHPIPFRFEFDPPYALAGPGHYYFAILGVPCSGFFDLLLSDRNPYVDGATWLSGRTYFSGCRLRDYPEQYPLVDFVFTIEFCKQGRDDARFTWGRVKATYR
jgi:hypothetical protein